MLKQRKSFKDFWSQHAIPFLNLIKKWIWDGAKFCGRLIYLLAFLLALVIISVIPFLSGIMDQTVAQWHWYPGSALFLILLIADRYRHQTSAEPTSAIESLRKAGEVLILPTFFCVFAFNYYAEPVGHWITFAAIALVLPCFFLLLILYDNKHKQRSKKETAAAITNLCKYVLLIWLFDLLYMAIFNGCQTLIYVFGAIAIVVLLCSLASTFLSETKALRFLLPLDLLLAIGLIAYLAYIIPDEVLRNVILAITESVLGGLIALVGVAWTIKHTNASRQEDLTRIENERREEERKKHIPYLRISFEKELPTIAVNAHIRTGIDFNNPDDLRSLEGNVYFCINVNDFSVKNVSNANVILKGVILHQKYYSFDQAEIVEPGACCKVKTTNNYMIAMPCAETSISLIVDDILDNTYEVICPVSYDLDSMRLCVVNKIGDTEYMGYNYTYIVSSAKLPILVPKNNAN